MDKGTGITVEVDTLLRVEEHILSGINLENEIFQGAHTHDAGNLAALLFGHIIKLAQFHRGLISILDHQRHQVISVNNSSLTALHLTIGQFHHAVREVNQLLTPLEAKTVEQDRKHLEVIVLFVAHHIDHLIDGEVLETHLGRTDVLRHIDRGAVRTQQQFLIQTLVGQVGPNRVVLVALKQTLSESFLYFGLTLQVGLTLVVDLIKRNAHLLVGLVETGIYPVVHLLPQGANLRIVVLPFYQHLVSLLDERSLLLCLFLCLLSG